MFSAFPDPSYPQWCSPTGAALGDLSKPGVVPACDDRLTIGLARVMMVVAPLWTGFGIAARPDAGIDRIPGGRGFQGLLCHEVLQPGQGHGSGIERVINTAPATLEAGGQAQMDGVLDDRTRKPGIQDLD